MQNDTKAAFGVGAATLAGSLWGQVRGIARAAETMNAQIDRDLYTLGATGHLPEDRPVLPLATRPKNKIVILLTSLLAGFLLVAGTTALLGTALVDSNAPTPLLRVLEVVVGATIVGIIFGWVPGAAITIVRFLRDNVRRAQSGVIERYAAYWAERQRLQAGLRAGSLDPYTAAQRLAVHALDTGEQPSV